MEPIELVKEYLEEHGYQICYQSKPKYLKIIISKDIMCCLWAAPPKSHYITGTTLPLTNLYEPESLEKILEYVKYKINVLSKI